MTPSSKKPYSKRYKLPPFSPGAFLKEKILEEYPTLESFAEAIDIYPNTLRQYLRSSQLGSDKFKIKVTQALQIDMDKLFKSRIDAITDLVWEVHHNSSDYVFRSDLEFLEALHLETKRFDMSPERQVMMLVLGKHYLSQCEFKLSEGLFQEAVTQFNYLNEYEWLLRSRLCLAICYASQIHYRIFIQENESLLNTEIGRIRALYKSLSPLDESLEYEYQYSTGKIYAFSKQFPEAIEAYKTAEKHIQHSTHPERLYHSLGFAYGGSDDLQAALMHYQKVLQILDESDPFINRTYLNIACVNILLGERQIAHCYRKMINKDIFFKMPSGFYHYCWNLLSEKFHDRAFDDIPDMIQTFWLTLNDPDVFQGDKAKMIQLTQRAIHFLHTHGVSLEIIEGKIINHLVDNPSLPQKYRDQFLRYLGEIRLFQFNHLT